MTNIFISYSRETKETALRIRRDLQLNGITEIFLDLDPIDGLKAGSIWQEELRRQVFASKAILLLISQAWLKSPNCRLEYYWALEARERARQNPIEGRKPIEIIPIFLSDVGFETLDLSHPANIWLLSALQQDAPAQRDSITALGKLNSYDLKVSLELNPDATADRGATDANVQLQSKARQAIWGWLEPALDTAGITPMRVMFRGNRPYPGLEAFDEESARVFFGREAETDDCIERLSEMRVRRGRNMFVIQGASGSGKSSVLRAGVLSRLKIGHEDDFYCLPTVRPGQAAVTGPEGLAASLVNAFKPQKNYPAKLYQDPKTNIPKQFPRLEIAAATITEGAARQAINSPIEQLEELLNGLRNLASPQSENGEVINPVTLVLPIDQAEEMLPVGESAEDDPVAQRLHKEARQLREVLRDLLARRNVNLIAVLSIRSDSFPRLQNDATLGNTIDKQPYDLSPLPTASYRSVIEGPANEWEIDFDPALISRLLADIEGQGDALPLLAFVLRRLHNALDPKETRLKTRIELEDYVGDRPWSIGGIQNALQKVVDGAIGKDVDDELLRKLFIGHLVSVDPSTNQVLRKIGLASEFPPGGLEIAKKLRDEARILRSDSSDEAFEVHHEAVLRQWQKLTGMIDQSKFALAEIQRAENDAAKWWEKREKTVAESGEVSNDVADWDAENLPTQASIESIREAINNTGRDWRQAKHPLSSFIEPELKRLTRALEIPDRPITKRQPIGERFAELGTVNTSTKHGDPRPGVNDFTPESIEHWLKGDVDEARRHRLEECKNKFASASASGLVDPEKLGDLSVGIPDIEWCPVPPGEVVIRLDDKAMREWAEAGAKGEPPAANPSLPQTVGGNVQIAKYPITLAQYIAFVGNGLGQDRAKQYRNAEWWAGFPTEPEDMSNSYRNMVQEQNTALNHPAQYVTWYQAVAYCRWLTALMKSLDEIPQNAEIRLPFEAEWVQAATGGKPYRFPWGNDWNPNYASSQDSGNKFVAVGLYPLGQSPTGAMDMSGNVYEWCLDAYDDIGNPALTEERARATRGGAYFTQPMNRPVEHALSIYHRFSDRPYGLTAERTDTRAARIAAGIRPVLVVED